MEWHLERKDDPVERQPNQVYRLCIPVICVYSGENGNRYRQVGVPSIEEEGDSKSPLDSVTNKMRDENMKRGTKFTSEDIGSPVQSQR